MGILPYINFEDVFMCTDPHATKERQKATPVHSATTRISWMSQPFPSTAEIGSIAPGMATI